MYYVYKLNAIKFIVISYICSVLADDDFTFVFDHVEPIREDDEYQGLRAFLFIDYDGTRGTLTMDITTGDSIYPSANPYTLGSGSPSGHIP